MNKDRVKEAIYQIRHQLDYYPQGPSKKVIVGGDSVHSCYPTIQTLWDLCEYAEIGMQKDLDKRAQELVYKALQQYRAGANELG